MTASRRARLHLRIGEREETAYGEHVGINSAELALHFEQGRDYRKAVQYRQQAAETALQRYAYLETISHLKMVLERLETLPDTSERIQQEFSLRNTLGIALHTARGMGSPEVEQEYTRARELLKRIREPEQLFQALFGQFFGSPRTG